MVRVSFGINQAIETIRENCEPQGPIVVEARFDEFNLDVKISYRGAPLELPDERPSDRDIMETEEGYRRLAGFLLRRNADRVRTSVQGRRLRPRVPFRALSSEDTCVPDAVQHERTKVSRFGP